MDSTILDLGEDLSGFLATLSQEIDQTAREMTVFEFYRRSLVSSGKAAELLGISRLVLIQRTANLGMDRSGNHSGMCCANTEARLRVQNWMVDQVDYAIRARLSASAVPTNWRVSSK